eukprot:Skav207251  [mRNA]  locus=scaffold2560:27905:28759:+ [translate_table: standard]
MLRRQPTAFIKSIMASLDQILLEEELELDERAAAVAIAFQDIMKSFLYLGHLVALEEPWLVEPRDCFDDVLFRKLLLALQSGADLRRRLGGRGLQRPGRSLRRPGRADSSPNAGLAATRGARLARLLTAALPVASDDDQTQQEKLADLILREQEIKEAILNEAEEPKFSAKAWREGSRRLSSSVPAVAEKPLPSPEDTDQSYGSREEVDRAAETAGNVTGDAPGSTSPTPESPLWTVDLLPDVTIN